MLFSNGGSSVAVASGHLQRSLIRKLRRSLSTHVGGRVWRDYCAAAMHRLKNSACRLCSTVNEISMTKKPYWQINVGLPGRPCKALIKGAMSTLFSTLGSLLCAVCRPKQNESWATPPPPFTSALGPHPVASRPMLVRLPSRYLLHQRLLFLSR